ncbi:MAG: hypothetical protein ACHQAQ_19185 [Hyphomicrobiales bacterium]
MSQSLSLAQDVVWNLATTLMVCVTLFKADIGFGVLPTSEFDDDPDSVVARESNSMPQLRWRLRPESLRVISSRATIASIVPSRCFPVPGREV